MSRLQRVFILLSCLSGLSSCKSETHVEPSFYYWRTRFEISPAESTELTKLGAKRLYVRFFDIDYEDYSDVIVPIGRLENGETFPKGMEIVPVIFIKNRIFGTQDIDRDPYEEGVPAPAVDTGGAKRLTASKIQDLADKIVRKVQRMVNRYTGEPLKEIQLDCDWSPSTKDPFFALVAEIKRLIQPAKVSATIRLYQFKYADKVGVPPADRGMLMYYNMSSLKDTNTRNYILDNREGEKYIDGAKKYPLPLDFALPIHTQGSVYSYVKNYDDERIKTRFSGLVTGELFEQLKAEGQNFEPIAPNMYKVLRSYSNYQNQTWLQEGQIIRYDDVSNEELIKAADAIASLANTDSYHVTFFHLDSLFLAHHPHETLARTVDQFR